MLVHGSDRGCHFSANYAPNFLAYRNNWWGWVGLGYLFKIYAWHLASGIECIYQHASPLELHFSNCEIQLHS